MSFTLIPAVFAPLSSKVTYISLSYINISVIRHMTPTIPIKTISETVTVKILPNKNESTLAVAFPLLVNIIAIPKLSVRTIDITSSAYFL